MAKPSRLSGPATKIGRAVGGSLGGKVGKTARGQVDDPIIGAIVGAASLYVAGKLLPRRVVAISAAVAAGYVTRKLAQRTERIQVREERTERVNAREADAAITQVPVAPVKALPKL